MSGKHQCNRCGALAANRPDWGRYESSGRLKALCPECDQHEQDRRARAQARKASANAAGYENWFRTPEAHRLHRERKAAKQGRRIETYTPKSERERRARMREADRIAGYIRAQWVRDWLKPFRKAETELYRTDSEYREQHKAEVREHYRRCSAKEVARVLAYKRAHPDRNNEWTATRLEREAMLADGTVTPQVIERMKREATTCAYCACRLTHKQTDHMIPLVLGGEHSLRNIVIVCPTCNGRKGRLSYAEWVERVDPEHRDRVLSLYRERYQQLAA